LHTSRRLSGNKSFEALLEKTGQEGFSVEKNDVAVMFADIRGFTNISEGMDPQELVSLLNGYLSSMIRAVNMHGGYVVQVLGDAVMAVFTLPEDDRDEADRAAIAALIMVEENRKLNNRHAGRYPALRIGVGIHFGEVVTGLIGSALKRSYTLIGDVVNTASRIEGLTKILDVPILVTEEVGNAMEAKDQHLLMPMGKFVPYGREEPVSVYALLGLVGNNAASKKDAHCIKRAHEALTCFEARKFAQASKLYLELHKVTEISGFQYLAAQADHFQNKPPAKDWSGAIELQTK
ncbi:MAG: adenylate/guanylate cyclase domain-containing protein, partial [Saprospiraceae bacterium]|nr:adenylate/guanylate cyclase domain-containing protein [Saprospiraceae bacterium]